MAANPEVKVDHQVAYMETDCKMSAETAVNIVAMDTKDSTPELASTPIFDSRKISEIYIDIEKKLQIASEEMARDINKVSEILLDFQKELSMPAESSVALDEPLEISEILMEMNKDMKPVEGIVASDNADSSVAEVDNSEENKIVEENENAKEETKEDSTDTTSQEVAVVNAEGSGEPETHQGEVSDPAPLQRSQPEPQPLPEATETPEATEKTEPAATETPKPSATPKPTATETPEPAATPERAVTPEMYGAVPGQASVETNGFQDSETQTTKQKKKKSKELDHISRTMMQTLNGLDSPDEKINTLCKKYADLTAEHRLLTTKFKVQQKQFHQLQREKDHLQSEHSKAVLAKSKLESLCRELQRHNKVVKDESVQRARDEEEKRKELCAKFQQTINDITNQMQDNHAKNIKLKEENVELASKLKSLVEQYERREEHIEKMFKHKELELQLSDAKLQESGLNLAQEKERNLREKTVILTEAADYQRKCEILQAQEVQLKGQLAIYTEKFEEFQGTLTKSNEVFQQFKQEMDKMTKKIKKLEKETCTWRTRWEVCNMSLVEMAEEKTIRDKELAAQSTKIQKLEKLCRALQAERNALSGKTKPASRSASSSPTPAAPSSDQSGAPSDQSDPPEPDKQASDEQPVSADERGPPEGASSPQETIQSPAGDDKVQSAEPSGAEKESEDKSPDP